MALILTRRPRQSIKIGDDITVWVDKLTSGKTVHLGIDAPKDVSIVRTEIANRARRAERDSN